jgi:response regulator of citrate/malate metabolism
MLPDGSGIDLIREVRANDPEAEIMVVSAMVRGRNWCRFRRRC